MASSRKRFVSDQFIAFFHGTESSNEEDDKAEETLSEYIWVDLVCLQGDKSPQVVTNDENAGAVRVRNVLSFPAQKDMNVGWPKYPDRREDMRESKRSGGNGDISDKGRYIDEYGRQYDWLTVFLDLPCVRQWKGNAIMNGTALNMQQIGAVGSLPRSTGTIILKAVVTG